MEGLAGPAWFGLLMYFLNWCSQQYWKYVEKKEQTTEQLAVITNREIVRAMNSRVEHINKTFEEVKVASAKCANVLNQWQEIYGEQEKFALAREKDAETHDMMEEVHELLTRKDAKDRHLLFSLVDNLEKVEDWLRQTKKVVDANSSLISRVGEELKRFSKYTQKFKGDQI